VSPSRNWGWARPIGAAPVVQKDERRLTRAAIRDPQRGAVRLDDATGHCFHVATPKAVAELVINQTGVGPFIAGAGLVMASPLIYYGPAGAIGFSSNNRATIAESR
jgi:hypothetical protein